MSLNQAIGIIPKTSILKILNDQTSLCNSAPDRFIKAISYITRIYYGLNVDSEKDTAKKMELVDVFSVFRNKVFEKHPFMTFEQLNLIYSESIIEKRKGVALTVDELMSPIASYYAKIQFVLQERNIVLRERLEKEEIEAKKQAHHDESIKIYVECVCDDGIWKGTPYHANVFAKESFAHKFKQSEKNEFYEESKQKVKELESQRKVALNDGIEWNIPIPNDIQMFSQLIVTEACKRGYEIIVG